MPVLERVDGRTRSHSPMAERSESPVSELPATNIAVAPATASQKVIDEYERDESARAEKVAELREALLVELQRLRAAGEGALRAGIPIMHSPCPYPASELSHVNIRLHHGPPERPERPERYTPLQVGWQTLWNCTPTGVQSKPRTPCFYASFEQRHMTSHVQPPALYNSSTLSRKINGSR